MTISLPKNLYSGNSGIFSSTPYTNFAINQLAQKQAKRDAIDQYYADQLSKVNGQGLAPSEQEALLGTKDNMLNYQVQNKKLLDNGDPNTTAKMNQYLAKMKDIIGRGKYKTDQAKVIQRVLTNPESSSRLTNTARQGIDASNAPIYSKGADGDYNLNPYDQTSNPTGYQPFNLYQHLFNEQPYTSAQMQTQSDKYSKSLKPDSVKYIPVVLPDGSTSKTQMQSLSSYSNDAQKQIVADKENAYNQDDKLAYTVDKGQPFAQLKNEHEADFNTLNDVYKNATGKDITNGAGLYAASELMRMTAPQAVSKPIVNSDAKIASTQAYGMNKMYKQNALIKGRMQYAKSLKDEGSGDGGENAWQSISDASDNFTKAQNNGYKVTVNGKAGVKEPINLDNGNKMYGIPLNSINNASSQAAITKILSDQKIKTDGSNIFIVPNKDGTQSIRRTSDGSSITSINAQQVQKAIKSKQVVTKGTSQAATPSTQNIQVQINGKVYKMPKGSLQKLDKDKVQYKIIN